MVGLIFLIWKILIINITLLSDQEPYKTEALDMLLNPTKIPQYLADLEKARTEIRSEMKRLNYFKFILLLFL